MGQVKFVVIYKCLLLQIAREILWLLVINVNERASHSQDRPDFESMSTVFVVCTHITTLHVLNEYPLLFSQSEVHSSFMYTTNSIIEM